MMITLVNCVAPHASVGGFGVPPPGLLSLAAAVREAGFSVRLADLAASGPAGMPAPEAFPQWLGEITPLVGFSTMSNMLPYTLEAARCLKAASPQTTILLGGCGAQTAPREVLERFPFIDFIFQGEAEHTLPAFLRQPLEPEAWAGMAGLAFRRNGKVVVNPPAQRIRDLDALPLPAYDLTDFPAYGNQVSLLTSRGCPFSCAYCEGGVLWRGLLTTRSVPRVLAEIKHLQERHSISKLGIADDSFTTLRARAAEFCRAYLDGGWNFAWGCAARVDGPDEALLRLMAQANCREIYFGVESGSDRTLENIRKGVTHAQIAEMVPRAKEHFSQVIASFMWGFPFESLEDFEETLMLAAYLRSYGVTILMHLWSPMPRSPLFEQYRDQLAYDPKVQSSIVVGDVTRYQSLIASNSKIFAPFFHVPHPGFAEKRRMIEAMGFAG